MKTIAVVFVLSCLCFASGLETHLWGNVRSRVLGEETIVVNGAQSQYQIRAFSFPHISDKKDPIIGIKQFDYAAKPSEVTFVYGGVNRREVALLVKSARNHGINSTFVFYGM